MSLKFVFSCAFLSQIPAINLQLASSLPINDYHNNAFRNSFYYQVFIEVFIYSLLVLFMGIVKATIKFYFVVLWF